MSIPKLFDAEYKFACIIWEFGPINSTELVKICMNRLGWKKSTTYTVLKKLCERGIMQNQNSVVSALVDHEQVQKYESEELLARAFDGSLPLFLATFLQDRKLTKDEADELSRMIKEASE